MSDSKTIVLITGANTGIGLEVVRALAASNRAYTIIVTGRNLQKVKEAIEQVKKEHPNSASTYDEGQIDIESDESIDKAVEKLSSKYDHIDVLVNNAGKLSLR
jgi:NADP-dependent 3-hydroxy acid dehydrogenase YdfG